MNLIFLDIDGVLITRRTRRSPDWKTPDPRCVRRLNELIERTGAQIVVSSVWRLGRSLDDLEALFRQWGVAAGVLDKTPHMDDRDRGDEIAAWLRARAREFDCLSFVIVDDDADMGELRSRLVQTSFDFGLSRGHVRQAIKMFKEQTK